jgi:hypothetical protein
VHELSEHRAAFGVYSLHHWAPSVGLRRSRETGLVEVSLAVLRVRVDAFGDNQPEAASGESRVVARVAVCDQAVFGGTDSRHG